MFLVLVLVLAVFSEHVEPSPHVAEVGQRPLHSRDENYNKTCKMMTRTYLPNATPTGGTLREIRLPMLATRTKASQDQVIYTFVLGAPALRQHWEADAT